MSDGNGLSQTPLNSAFSRVWLQKGRARPDHRPIYKGFYKLAGFDQNFGSITPIFVPSKSRLGKFEQAGIYRDAEERPTSSLVGHYAADMKSELIALAKEGCPADIQLHIGKCNDPSVFDDFQKVLIFEEVFVESISSDDLGALEPGEQGKVDETGDISARTMYEYMPLAWASRNPAVVTNELMDVTIDRTQSCGDCEVENSGCEDIYAISKSAGGSPSTPADVVFSLDKGKNWAAHDVDSLGVAEEATGIAIVGQYIVVVSPDSASMHIALRSQFRTGDPDFTEITNGFVVSGGPRAIWSVGTVAYIVGNNGYIYKVTNAANGVDVIDAGVATTSRYLAVHALSSEWAIAVGEDGVITVISGGLAARVNSPVGIGEDILTVWAASTTEFLIGTSAGRYLYTLDGGQTWTDDSGELGGGGTKSAITSIRKPTSSVVYVAGTVDGAGAVWSSLNGGYSFEREKRGTGQIPTTTRINALAVCGENDPDFVVGVGLSGSDGIIVVGADAEPE